MKTRIIYFSQTGNSLKIGEQIASGIEAGGNRCELVNLTTTDPATQQDCDLLGIGCPVYYYKEPFNVSAFMDELPPGEGKHAFVYITHGSVPGTTLESMWNRLVAKGYLVLGAHNSYADAFLPFYPYPTLTSGHPDEQDCSEARAFGQKIVEVSAAVAAGDKSVIPQPFKALEGWWQEEAKMFTPESLFQFTPKLSINQQKCIQCQACEEACPVGGIASLGDSLRIQEPCIYCFQCVTVCPELAIETDWSVMKAIVPENFRKYREALDGAAERGEFRWLVDPDTINIDDPIIEQKKRALAARESGE